MGTETDDALPFFETGQAIKFSGVKVTLKGEQLVGVKFA